MNRSVPLALAMLATTGCYTPQGAFVGVDEFQFPSGGDTVLAQGDLINVQVFQQEALSGRMRIRHDGKVSLAMLGDVIAAGKSPVELSSELQARFKDFINNPRVNVVLEESRPVSIAVVGEVVRPGITTLDSNSGVLTAIASAGGLNDFAHRNGIFVLRRLPGEAAPRRVHFTWAALTQGQGKANRFTLQPGDTVVVE